MNNILDKVRYFPNRMFIKIIGEKRYEKLKRRKK